MKILFNFSKLLCQATSRAFGRSINKVNPNNVVFITGCDSGLGYSLARKCYDLNVFVVAGCLSHKSDGAVKLQEHCDPKRFILVEIDIRKNQSILLANKKVTDLLESNKDLVFTALINNAGVMCFGEFEWQTNSLIDYQIEINLLGTMKFTKEFLPLVRQYKTRIIMVTSHCALEALPGLAPYGATKAGLKFFNDALRVELNKYEIHVVNFVPGSFVMTSNICARQQEYAEEMEKSFSIEQKEFYGDYFKRYNDFLKFISGYKEVNVTTDKALLNIFQSALLDKYPKAIYKCEPWRYTFYHFFFKRSPTFIRDWLVIKFMQMPKFIGK